MGNMKFKVGDRVRIKSLDWYNENKDNNREIKFENGIFTTLKSTFLGQIMTIEEITLEKQYILMEDRYKTLWTDEMIEGLVEEETKPKYEDEMNGEYYSTPKYLVRPNGYQFVDENGNVISTTKIVLEKKKEYPKTYDECCQYLGCDDKIKMQLIGQFTRLINARNAYWKLYGEEMGLGKPWEPDWRERRYIIYRNQDDIIGGYREAGCVEHHIFEFPTEEMRDAFYEAFKEDIEMCKELL